MSGVSDGLLGVADGCDFWRLVTIFEFFGFLKFAKFRENQERILPRLIDINISVRINIFVFVI